MNHRHDKSLDDKPAFGLKISGLLCLSPCSVVFSYRVSPSISAPSAGLNLQGTRDERRELLPGCRGYGIMYLAWRHLPLVSIQLHIGYPLAPMLLLLLLV
jgi:hypothetical protein